MQLHFFNTDSYKTYEDAKAANAIYSCDAPAFDDEVHRYGFNGGVLCDAMQAVYTALECLGMQKSIDAVLIDGDKRINWGDEE